MLEKETCAECEALLLAGGANVFCPACALRQALKAGNARDFNSRLPGGADKRILASPETPGKQYETMIRVAPNPGDIIGDYEILEKIGGNMGLVFKARQRRLDKIVALKLLPAGSRVDAIRLARFDREIRALGQLAHPNLVTASDARQVDCWHLLTMEWIDGLDLQQLVRIHGTLPASAACEVVRLAALGLQYAHEHGLIHRDIKPSNLMLTGEGSVKVIDLGIALAREETPLQITEPGFALGTMSYCAPEQFRDASNVDIRADIYSLGCTLYHLLTGKAPYSDRRTLPELIHAHINDPFPSAREERLDVPVGLEAVLARMTTKDPAGRYPSAGAVAEALKPFATNAHLRALFQLDTRQPPAQRISVAPAYSDRLPQRSENSSPRRKFSPRIAASVAVIIVLLAAGILFLMNARQSPIVVLMDTTATGGVYDEEARGRGLTNAEELARILHDLLPDSLRQETISSSWEGEAQVLAMRPRLVLIHRSAFFHSLNAEFKFGLTNEFGKPFAKPSHDKNWTRLYDLADERLRVFLGFVGTVLPRTKFLVYSRGTDVKWKNSTFREQWKKDLENHFPKLRGRVKTMLVQPATFKDPETAAQIRDHVKTLLGLEEQRH